MTNSADPKPTDLDLHCLLRQGMSCAAREGLRRSFSDNFGIWGNFLYCIIKSYIVECGYSIEVHCQGTSDE